MEYNSGSDRASHFKSAKRVALSWFEIMSTITPELYNTKSYYQKSKKLFNSMVEKGLSKSKENISESKSLNQLISAINFCF